MFSYSVDNTIFMTETYQTPINFEIVRKFKGFDEDMTVEKLNLVGLTYTNEGYYINYPDCDDEEWKNEAEHFVFQKLDDISNMDINAYFVVEQIKSNNRIKLRHFNSGKYLKISNAESIENDYVTLIDRDDVGNEDKIELIPINEPVDKVTDFSSKIIFKVCDISEGRSEDLKDAKFLKFPGEEDIKKLKEKVSFI